ncbi:MAG: hypothetical protein P1U74_06495 [Legionellaceae bacterium]|nr:hypothetical protein [Legionellaceae bacterium]
MSSNFSLPIITKRQQTSLLKSAEQVLINQQKLPTDYGGNILNFISGADDKHIKLKHYPLGDRIDFATGGQYFYHCHRENKISNEHGHFHCYIRTKFIPKYIKPLNLPPIENIKHNNKMTHLLAIGMNRLGQPIRLFTVNRWVTSEQWYSARYASNLTKRFKMNLSDESSWRVVDKWLEGILHLFLPQIVWLQKQRDIKVASYKKDLEFKKIFTNKKIEEISEISINLQDQIQWLIDLDNN